MAKQEAIHVVVITPERQVVDTHTDSLIVPAHDGQIGFLKDRAPLMCELGAGMLKYRKGNDFKSLEISGGFAQVHHNEAIILTERCSGAEA